jgi:hypothetical protein
MILSYAKMSTGGACTETNRVADADSCHAVVPLIGLTVCHNFVFLNGIVVCLFDYGLLSREIFVGNIHRSDVAGKATAKNR